MTQFARIVNTSNNRGDTVEVVSGGRTHVLRRGDSVNLDCHGKGRQVTLTGSPGTGPRDAEYVGEPVVSVKVPEPVNP